MAELMAVEIANPADRVNAAVKGKTAGESHAANEPGQTETREYERELVLAKGEADIRAAITNLVLAQSAAFVHSTGHNIADTTEIFGRIQEDISLIGKQSTSIKKILQKTRILSVNAAVEAAHVGAAGKGFGVVAEEIGSLANQTESSTGEVERLSRSLSEESGASMDALKVLKDGLTGFGNTTGVLATQANKLITIEENGFILTTLAKRLENHADFIRNIVKNAGTLDSVTDHHKCAFGKWYDQNKDRYRHLRGFPGMYDTHRSFHAAAIEFNATLNYEYLNKLVVLSTEMLEKFLVLFDAFRGELRSDDSYFDLGRH